VFEAHGRASSAPACGCQDAQRIGAAGAAPTRARRKAFWVLFRREKGLAGRRPVKALLCGRAGRKPVKATFFPNRCVVQREKRRIATSLRRTRMCKCRERMDAQERPRLALAARR